MGESSGDIFEDMFRDNDNEEIEMPRMPVNFDRTSSFIAIEASLMEPMEPQFNSQRSIHSPDNFDNTVENYANHMNFQCPEDKLEDNNDHLQYLNHPFTDLDSQMNQVVETNVVAQARFQPNAMTAFNRQRSNEAVRHELIPVSDHDFAPMEEDRVVELQPILPQFEVKFPIVEREKIQANGNYVLWPNNRNENVLYCVKAPQNYKLSGKSNTRTRKATPFGIFSTCDVPSGEFEIGISMEYEGEDVDCCKNHADEHEVSTKQTIMIKGENTNLYSHENRLIDDVERSMVIIPLKSGCMNREKYFKLFPTCYTSCSKVGKSRGKTHDEFPALIFRLFQNGRLVKTLPEQLIRVTANPGRDSGAFKATNESLNNRGTKRRRNNNNGMQIKREPDDEYLEENDFAQILARGPEDIENFNSLSARKKRRIMQSIRINFRDMVDIATDNDD